ncbi:MAG: shikimate dehydrogenase [Dehalococcoidia bacterium]|nr:shikimate dehydrogenase [Dehalococcoidia bacterium]
MTRNAGIMGYPLKHSISPIFQQAAFDHLGLDVRYCAWELPPGEVAGMVQRLRQPEYLGANVTVPYKETLISMVDALADSARLIGAVNTVVNRAGKLEGHNTDAGGFLHALREDGAFEPEGKVALVLGAGGAARAICFALAEAGAAAVYITNRTPERAQTLVAVLGKQSATRIATLPWSGADLAKRVKECHLIVNCTTMGMRHSYAEGQSPLPAGLIPKGALVFDVIYNPIETPFLKEAAEAGARTLGGLSMLIYQGAASFELWTGQKAPVSVMFEAGARAMQAQG